jgi:hypothetical protein
MAGADARLAAMLARGRRFELVADRARAVDDHELAVELQGRDLLLGPR